MRSAVRRESAFLRLWWAVQSSVALGTVISLAAGAALVAGGAITVGTAFLLFQYALLIERPLEDVVHQLELVQFAMPYGSAPQHQQWRVDVSSSAQSIGVGAALIGRAAQSVPGLQGENWLLSIAPSGAGAGTRVRVISQQGKPQTGVLVPVTAVIRFAGKTWVYVQTEADRFERTALPADRAMAEGFFTDTLDADTSVVTSGAQLLLSEEFRFQIKNENKD